ncbi:MULTISPECIES: hypothetical protein [Pseudomonas]|uniref:hypothetical protein n=1 Tax=Pseudomonas TaxID=286 RepID=UPI00056FCA3B|nr:MULTISPECIES: hypothetical protein [Pseudomonas]MBP2839347.1 hypothetical protein [Pseudomonas sp. PNP]MCK2122746.1 hypothetical protein [Pseudomonas sp. PNPG3]QUN65206.1 hypothetical protein KDB76_14935 [Pseudomonas sp. JS425]
MEHKHISGLIDVIKVDQPADILKIARDGAFDRAFGPRKPLLNSLLVGRILRVLSYEGRRFPTMSAKNASGRERQQDDLWRKLNAAAPEIRAAPDSLQPLADWTRNANSDIAVGPLLQEVIGRLFNQDFRADENTWTAAQVIAGSLTPGNTWRNLRWRLSGKVTQAKALLASRVNGDLAGVHGISVAIHNVVKGMHQMRTLYLDPSHRNTLTPEMVGHLCLYAPGVVLRQATTKGQISGCPFSSGTLFLLELEKARQASGDESMVFLGDSWSRCPAEQWVPALLEGVWRRATKDADHGHVTC